MKRMYSVKSSSRRWSNDAFFNIINSALINNRILYKHVCKEDINQREFIQRLCEELTDSMPSNASENKDELDKPSCKISCVANRNDCASKPSLLTYCFVK